MARFTSGLLVNEIVDEVINDFAPADSHRVGEEPRTIIQDTLREMGDGDITATEAHERISGTLLAPFGSVFLAQEASSAILFSVGVDSYFLESF